VTTITPITTLIQGKISQGKTRSEAESEVASLLGITTDKLYIDYEALNDTTLQSKAYSVATTMQNNGNSISSTISSLGGGSSSSGDSGGGGDSSSGGSSGGESSGGGGDTPTPDPTPDPVTPTITASNFTYGTAIGGSAKTFDWKTLSSATDSDGHSLSATIKTQGSKGTSSIDGDNITYTPSANKEGSNSIVITITDTLGGAKDITITVTGIDTVPPTISATFPSAGATDVGVYSWIDINFSEPMDSTTLTTANITISGGNNDKSCQKVEYIGGDGNTTRCYPYVTTASHKLDDNTTYTLTVTTNVKDSNGNAMANTGNTVAFTTGVENKLPRLRTGQTKCYNSSNAEVADCQEDSGALKDDGWYVANGDNGGLGIARNFSRDDVNGIVTDNASGLMWQDNADVANINRKKSWLSANTYCETTIDNYGNYTDWRLSSIEELTTIINKGTHDPAVFDNGNFQAFSNVAFAPSDAYWGTARAPETSNAWIMYSDDGYDSFKNKSNSAYVRCVRGEQHISLYVGGYSKQIVLDVKSGLMWQDNTDTSDSSKKINWMNAINYCEDLSLGGYDDWRLPNYEELYQLADRSRYQPAISPVFMNISSSYYWSSTTYDSNATYARYVNFLSGGFVGYITKSTNNYVRCVRGGL